MITFKLAAKTDVGLVRTNNEDNFQVASDLSAERMGWVNNAVCSLGDKGALLVVADGMGGMNAGEVASELAINTIRDYFAADRLTEDVTRSRYSIEKYMNEAIVAADARIKGEAKDRPETRGMGTTIVVGWVLGDKLYVSWCGDSRAYVYNGQAGLHQITKDHSYVQQLVDRGSITREEAFDFPDSNIITRSLGDSSSKARPESLLKPYTLCDGDIILLCTDGLSGMIRDNEMETVIRDNEHDMTLLADSLIHAACEAEGSDNITLCLCQIISGGAACDPNVFNETERRLNGRAASSTPTTISERKPKHKRLIVAIVLMLLLIIGGVTAWVITQHGRQQPAAQTADTIVSDTATKTASDSTSQPASDSTSASSENGYAATSEETTASEQVNATAGSKPSLPQHVKTTTPSESTGSTPEDVITPINKSDTTKGNQTTTPHG